MRSALTFVAAAAIGLTTASAVPAAELIRVGNAGRESFSFTPANIGKEVGIFAKHNLDLDIAGFGGDAKLQQAMAANAVDIGLGSGPGLAFIAKGSPVKGIAAMAGPPLIFAMVVRADVIEELISRRVAEQDYGVVIRDDLTLDEAATAQRRSGLRSRQA
jgi:ABC-type nitrate/sulfonate/bicarbonate transport system substrate-binding protein